MKKQILFGTIGAVAIAATAIVTVSSVNARSTESDLLTKNLEALTQGESGSNNTGEAVLITCPDGVSVGKYCMANGGSACVDIECPKNDGLIWAR